MLHHRIVAIATIRMEIACLLIKRTENIKQQCVHSRGIRISTESSWVEVVRETKRLRFGMWIRIQLCPVSMLARKCANCNSHRITMNSWLRMASSTIGSQCGSTRVYSKSQNSKDIRIEFYLWVFLQMRRILSQEQAMKHLNCGKYSKESHQFNLRNFRSSQISDERLFLLLTCFWCSWETEISDEHFYPIKKTNQLIQQQK